MLERSVYYDGLRPESVDELAHLSECLAMDALKKVNSRAMSLQTSDAGTAGARMRMNFGSYFFAVRTDDPPGDSREQECEDE